MSPSQDGITDHYCSFKQRNLGIYARCRCIFSWLSSDRASSETCCATRRLTWHQPLSCAALVSQRRNEQAVAAVVISAWSTAVSLQWLQQPFQSQGEGGLSSCKLAHQLQTPESESWTQTAERRTEMMSYDLFGYMFNLENVRLISISTGDMVVAMTTTIIPTTTLQISNKTHV